MKVEIINCFSKQLFIPVIKEKVPEQILLKIRNLKQNNFKIIEILYFEQLESGFLEQIKKSFSEIYLGVAGIKKAKQLVRLKDFVDFFTSPFSDQELLDFCFKHKIKLIPGAYTPNEIFEIQKILGTSVLIKLFPITSTEYFRQIQNYFPKQKFILSGVVLEQIEVLSQLGAFAFFSSRLFKKYNHQDLIKLRRKIKK